MSDVPGATGNAILGWRDETHVAVLRYLPGAEVFSVDVDTGESVRLLVIDQVNYSPGIFVAADAWAAPMVRAAEPDWPMDTRTRALLVALGVGAGWVGLLVWRRRRGRP